MQYGKISSSRDVASTQETESTLRFNSRIMSLRVNSAVTWVQVARKALWPPDDQLRYDSIYSTRQS